MKGSLKAMTFFKVACMNSVLFILIILYGEDSWYLLILSAAQLIFVPYMLHIILKEQRGWIPTFYPYFGIVASIAIFVLQITQDSPIDTILATIYFMFTIMLAILGVNRFLHRGFVHVEEFLIDIGLIYMVIGGAWFVAHEAQIDTGFSPIITWLTANHFHYSAFLLPVSVGLLGRVHQSKWYPLVATIIIISPMVVALGITFSVILEFVSVILYIIGIYGLIGLSFQTSFQNTFQKWFVRISYSALGISILFSLIYALGNLSERFFISIDFMILFHGLINIILFAGIGTIGWLVAPPLSKQREIVFPISKIRGSVVVDEAILNGKTDEQSYNGLIDSMKQFAYDIDTETLSNTIIDFYENTKSYRLFAEVYWHHWFLPLAIIYRQISRFIKQLNLPLSSRYNEMTGDIHGIADHIDGRSNTRAWVRKISQETVFVALYSHHQSGERTYMNIALPLPRTSMIGILELNQQGEHLQLTSKKVRTTKADSGIYLVIRNRLFRLPIEETFDVEEVEEGLLKARHRMWLFSIPFLHINYRIEHKHLPQLERKVE
ncbi:hypothetical protein GT022_03530 [Agaribacter marinus]|uniref:YndJ family protein n=2 Tax=Virgibacillus salarius TaxID=447199 RepID=A0A941DRA0_9BACI|nr:YndJ family protein [Virgibacillus salarius]NAZ07832.1 hypothetical protein [Agaribacter marinus]